MQQRLKTLSIGGYGEQFRATNTSDRGTSRECCKILPLAAIDCCRPMNDTREFIPATSTQQQIVSELPALQKVLSSFLQALSGPHR